MWCRVEQCDVKCNMNPTNYINITALVVWNVARTHTHETNGTQLHAHRQLESRGENVGLAGRFK